MNLYTVSFAGGEGVDPFDVYVAAPTIAKALRAAELNVASSATGITKVCPADSFIIVSEATTAPREELA